MAYLHFPVTNGSIDLQLSGSQFVANESGSCYPCHLVACGIYNQEVPPLTVSTPQNENLGVEISGDLLIGQVGFFSVLVFISASLIRSAADESDGPPHPTWRGMSAYPWLRYFWMCKIFDFSNLGCSAARDITIETMFLLEAWQSVTNSFLCQTQNNFRILEK